MQVNTDVSYEAFFQASNKFSQFPYYASALYCQALLESGNFKQGIYLKTGNPFGMKVPKVRSTVNAGEYQSGFEPDGSPRMFLVYSSLAQAVADRMMLDDYNKVAPPTDANDVVRYMQQVVNKGYAGDTNYLQKWQNLFKSHFTVGGANFNDLGHDASTSSGLKIFGISISLLLLVAGGFFLWKRSKNG